MENGQNQEKVHNSEILFIYEAEGCNPNGDPDNGNRPRKDSQGFIEVTDLRLKRYIRDYMERFDNQKIIIKEGIDGNSISKLINYAIKSEDFKAKVSTLGSKEKKEEQFLKYFKDIAYFGIVPGDNEADYLKFNYYGAVQFQYGKSYNKGEIESYGISPVFETLGEDHRLRYGVIGFYGVVNGMTADKNHLTNDDIAKLDEYIINGVTQMSRFSRSKLGQRPLIYVRIEYKDGFTPQNLRKLISIDKTEAIYSTSDFNFDISQLVKKIDDNIDNIESVKCFVANDINVEFAIQNSNKLAKLELTINNEQ